MISESLWVFGVSDPCVTRDISVLMIYESLGAVCGVQSLRNA